MRSHANGPAVEKINRVHSIPGKSGNENREFFRLFVMCTPRKSGHENGGFFRLRNKTRIPQMHEFFRAGDIYHIVKLLKIGHGIPTSTPAQSPKPNKIYSPSEQPNSQTLGKFSFSAGLPPFPIFIHIYTYKHLMTGRHPHS